MVITAISGPSLTYDQTRDGRHLAFRMELVRMKEEEKNWDVCAIDNVAGSICREVHVSTV
jgi:hypothetical protein